MFILVSIIERDIQVSAFATFLEAQEQMIPELKECLYPDVMSKEDCQHIDFSKNYEGDMFSCYADAAYIRGSYTTCDWSIINL